MSVPVHDGAAFERLGELLSPRPHPLETGVARGEDGALCVGARTDMPGCSGAMLEWWFRFACDDAQYRWWHPLDHVSSRWLDTSPGTHVGSTHVVQERLGDGDPTVHALHIHFVDPRELFGADAYDAALEAGDVSGCVAAQIGIGEDPVRDERGRPDGGRMAHICRDTPNGMVLRSRFFLGHGPGQPAEVLGAAIPDQLGLDLMQHAHTEFKFLARFLPSLHAGAHPETAALPW